MWGGLTNHSHKLALYFQGQGASINYIIVWSYRSDSQLAHSLCSMLLESLIISGSSMSINNWGGADFRTLWSSEIWHLSMVSDRRKVTEDRREEKINHIYREKD